MKESRMQPNPYPDDRMDTQPTEVNPPRESWQPGVSSIHQSPWNIPPPQGVAHPAPEVERTATEQENAYTFAYAIGKLMDFLGWVLLTLESLLLLRFLSKLIGADPTNPFASFLYTLTGVFLYIFRGIVADVTFGANGHLVFELTTLIAMLVYGLIFWLLRLFLYTIISRPKEPIG